MADRAADIENAPDLEDYLESLSDGLSGFNNYGILIGGVGPDKIIADAQADGFLGSSQGEGSLGKEFSDNNLGIYVKGASEKLCSMVGFEHDTAIRLGAYDHKSSTLLKGVQWFGKYIIEKDYSALGFGIGANAETSPIKWKRIAYGRQS